MYKQTQSNRLLALENYDPHCSTALCARDEHHSDKYNCIWDMIFPLKEERDETRRGATRRCASDGDCEFETCESARRIGIRIAAIIYAALVR